MRVRMTRTVRHFDRMTDPFLIGEEYDLPDPLAEAWIAYGVCTLVADSQEAPEGVDGAEGRAKPAKRRDGRERADHDALTGDER